MQLVVRTLDEALSRFKELRSEPYNSETVLNQDNQPYARLTLGVSRQDRTGDFDILHVRAGQNYLVTDFMRSPGYSDDPLFMRAMRRVADEVGFDSVTDYDKLPDGHWSNAIDVSFADWLKHKGVTELVPMPQQAFTSPEMQIENATIQGLCEDVPVISEDGAREIMQIFEDTKRDTIRYILNSWF